MAKVSVITATYNCASTVEACLASVVGQTHTDREHIVIDGASSDGTLQKLDDHRSQIDVLVSERDGGIYDALNKGIANASGDVIGFLHADDLYEDAEVISEISSAFDDPNVVGVFGDLIYVDRANSAIIRYWEAGEFQAEKLRSGWMPPHPTLYLRKSMYEEHGVFDTSFRIAADSDFMLRVLTRSSGHIRYLKRTMVRMRVGGTSNRSLSNIARKSAEDLRALRRNGVGGFASLAQKNFSKLSQFVRRPS